MQLLKRLVSQNVIKPADVAPICEAHAAVPGKALHEVIIEKGFAKEEDVLPVLADEFGMELVDLASINVEADTLRSLPLKLVHRRNLMPLSRRNGTLVVATGNPSDINSLADLATVPAFQIEPVLANPKEIARLIKTHFGVGGDTVAALTQERQEEQIELLEGLEVDDSEAAKMAQEASVVRLVNEILLEAANERASDIHVE